MAGDRRRVDLGPGATGFVGGVPDRDEVVELVTEQARSSGCTCDPLEVEVPANYGVRGEVAHVRALHDDDCPLVNP